MRAPLRTLGGAFLRLGSPYFTRVITLAPVTAGPSCVAGALRRGRSSLGSLVRSSASGITIPLPSQLGHWFSVPGVSPVPSHQSHSIINHRPDGAASRRRRHHRFALLDDGIHEQFDRLARNRTAVMRCVRRNLEGVAGLEGLVRLAVDLEDDRSFHHIVALDSRMGMAAHAGAGRDFYDGAHDVVARREIDGLQRRALDVGLLRNRRHYDDWRNAATTMSDFLSTASPPLEMN
jgi:hypothetical protein